MRRLLFHALALLGAVPLLADSTSELLQAGRVKTRLYVSAEGQTLRYGRDSMTMRDAKDVQTIAGSDYLVIAVPDFYPLRQRVTVNQTIQPDPNFTQLGDFLAKFTQFTDVLSESSGRSALAEKVGGISDLLSAYVQAEKETGAKQLGPCEALRLSLVAAGVAIAKPMEPSDQTVRGWIDDTTGEAGVRTTRKAITYAAKDLRDNVKTVRGALEAIVGPLSKLEKVPGTVRDLEEHSTDCPALDDMTIRAIVVIGFQADGVLTARTELAGSLDTLSKILEQFEKNWLDSSTTYRADSVTVDISEAKRVEVGISEVRLDGKTLRLEIVDRPATATFLIRRHQFLIPEAAAGLIFTGLKRKHYGTAEEGGLTVVAEAEPDNIDYSGALLLNGVMKTWEAGALYPMLQFGVSYTEDAPALLAGFGLRFVRPRRIGLAGGIVAGWLKELQTLKPGDPVTGTAAIESDLELELEFSYYLSIQYSF